MKKILIGTLLVLLPFTSGYANDMVNNLKASPEAVCEGNPQHKECIRAVNKMISATYQVTKAGSMCEQNKDKLHMLSDELQKQCSSFVEAMDYMESLKR